MTSKNLYRTSARSRGVRSTALDPLSGNARVPGAKGSRSQVSRLYYVVESELGRQRAMLGLTGYAGFRCLRAPGLQMAPRGPRCSFRRAGPSGFCGRSTVTASEALSFSPMTWLSVTMLPCVWLAVEQLHASVPVRQLTAAFRHLANYAVPPLRDSNRVQYVTSTCTVVPRQSENSLAEKEPANQGVEFRNVSVGSAAE